MNRKSAKGGHHIFIFRNVQPNAMTTTTCEREKKKQHTVNDYILVVLSLKRIQTQTHTQDQRKCEKTTNWAEKLVWEIGKSSNLAALHFVWICAFSDDASFYEWRGRADFEKYGSHHHLPIHLDLNLYLNSYLPICLSTQFSKCQFQSSQAKLSTSTMSTNHWQRCWYFCFLLHAYAFTTSSAYIHHLPLFRLVVVHFHNHFAYTIISTHSHK